MPGKKTAVEKRRKTMSKADSIKQLPEGRKWVKWGEVKKCAAQASQF
jgi:hypothetical protein